MPAILSFALAASLLFIIGFFLFAVAFEVFQRVRLHRLSPPTQLARADLGRYPYWHK
jgi:hypothetical protein